MSPWIADWLATRTERPRNVALQGVSHRMAAQACRFAHRWEQRGVWSSDGSRSSSARLARDGHVAKHNPGSMRVLEKCGFTFVGEDKEFSRLGDVVVEGVIYELKR